MERRDGARQLGAASVLAALMSASCVFEEPVFKSGLTQPPATLEGMWETMDAKGNLQHAALFPLREGTSLLQYPVATNGWWFEAQTLQLNDRSLLQLRTLAGPDAEPAAPGAKNFTLAWLESQPDGTLRISALDGKSIENGRFMPSSLRAFLSDASQGWDSVFGSPSVFRHTAGKK